MKIVFFFIYFCMNWLNTDCLQFADNHFGLVNFIDESSNSRLDICGSDSVCAKKTVYKHDPILKYKVADVKIFSQKWEILSVKKNDQTKFLFLFRLRNVENEKCMSVVSTIQTESDTPTRSVKFVDCNEADENQVWNLIQLDKRLYGIVSEALKLQLNSFFNGTLYLSAVESDEYKPWKMTFTELGNLDDILTKTRGIISNIEPLIIQSAQSGLVLSSKRDLMLQEQTPSSSEFQKWNIQQQSDGTVKIQNRETKFYLSFEDSNCITSVPNEEPDNRDQNWRLTKEDDFYYITNVANGKCLHRNQESGAILVDFCGEEGKWYIHKMNDTINEIVLSGFEGLFWVRNVKSDGYMSCDSNDRVNFNEKDAKKATKWKFTSFKNNDQDSQDFYLVIQSSDSKKFLYSRTSDGIEQTFCGTSSSDDDANQRWSLIIFKNSYFLFNRGLKKFLNGTGRMHSDLNSAYLNHSTYVIEFAMSNFNLTVDLKNFQFKSPSDFYLNSVSKFDEVGIQIINNPSSIIIQSSYLKETSLVNSWTIGFRESLNFGVKIKWEFSIPGIFEAELEAAFSAKLESYQKFGGSDTKTYKIFNIIGVPANRSVKAYSLIKSYDGLTIDFNADAYFRMFDSSSGRYYSGQAVADYIQTKEFNGQIKAITPYGVHATMSGTLVGNFGQSVEFMLQDLTNKCDLDNI